ncbi:RusA family crossover junction endodeoxyribonuclease [Nocardia farcinica]|uniref:RusA family crossover junction endodeoxyribonuclease n=1 Tax=Nocardia farcinica TaxID=37329 RepID=UPI0024571B8E|nr:RusA family crossover junction endodeoxyribonuclease [Nocardia farcinica]
MTDAQRMLTMFAALGLSETSESMHMVTIPGAPWSKSRPRFSKRGHAYSKDDDRDAELRTATFIRRVVKQPYTGNVGLACVFYRPNRQRVDTDNLIKHVCDAANGVLWLDDSQCTAVMGVIELDAENPRTVIAVGQHRSTLLRGTDAAFPCVVCATPIPMDGHGGKPPKTCSAACRQAARGYPDLSAPVPCGQCGTPFRRKTKTNRFCSKTCRIESLRSTKRAQATPMSKCSGCGKELTHKRGGRCRDCWRANPAETPGVRLTITGNRPEEG